MIDCCAQFIAGRHFEEQERASDGSIRMVVTAVQNMHRLSLQKASAAAIPSSNRMLLMLQRMVSRVAALSPHPLPQFVPALCAWVEHHVLLQEKQPLPYPLPALAHPLPPARRLVICHNDLQVGNIIWNPSSNSVQLIDFEHSGPNMRAYDIANFLCELCFSYHACPSGFVADFQRRFLPAHERQQLYAAYRRSWGDGADTVMDEVISGMRAFRQHVVCNAYPVERCRRVGGCHIKPRVLGGVGAAAGAAALMIAMLSMLLSVMKFDAVQVQICQNDAAESVPMDFQLCDALAPHPLLAVLDH
jgi:thiamine kinase-like enzyme